MQTFKYNTEIPDRLAVLMETIEPHRQSVLEHPVYGTLKTLDDVRVFMSHHVFAVWDFMCLLKTLQQKLTCVEVPWLPTVDSQSRRLINEIVLEEESDEITSGVYRSHYELYRSGMDACGASTRAIDALLEALSRGATIHEALATREIPAHVVTFATATARVLQGGQTHEIAGAFTMGREGAIPGMFRALIGRLRGRYPEELGVLVDYLERHIELDDERHGPMALQMLSNVCGDSEERWLEATQASIDALTARRALWDGVCATLRSH
jgi:hypothetical protein